MDIATFPFSQLRETCEDWIQLFAANLAEMERGSTRANFSPRRKSSERVIISLDCSVGAPVIAMLRTVKRFDHPRT
jgi:hypothetical protein